jgi:cell wall-associated NlpC family hydrolase
VAGRHRKARSHPNIQRIGVNTAGVVGATTVGLALVPGVANAATPAPPSPSTPGTPSASNTPHRPSTPQRPGPALPGPALPGSHSHGSHGDKVVHYASEQWGRPYVYGGSGPVAFDCSGLTKYVYGHFGVNLPHNAAEQYSAVQHVSKSDMRRGDLVFFYDSSGIYHVGIYAGGHQMWAASHTGDIVKKQAIYTSQFVVGRPS